ncbi:MAG: hypothetical protein EXS55_04370, partial [Candidatus Magasanikbacteria bacterium]|nr:hypothetical protein [Candidatus Magasanikbacteria bacterium]
MPYDDQGNWSQPTEADLARARKEKKSDLKTLVEFIIDKQHAADFLAAMEKIGRKEKIKLGETTITKQELLERLLSVAREASSLKDAGEKVRVAFNIKTIGVPSAFGLPTKDLGRAFLDILSHRDYGVKTWKFGEGEMPKNKTEALKNTSPDDEEAERTETYKQSVRSLLERDLLGSAINYLHDVGEYFFIRALNDLDYFLSLNDKRSLTLKDFFSESSPHRGKPYDQKTLREVVLKIKGLIWENNKWVREEDADAQKAATAPPEPPPEKEGDAELITQTRERILAFHEMNIPRLQRILGAGFEQAARIMKQLEATGVVGPSQRGFHEVLISRANISPEEPAEIRPEPVWDDSPKKIEPPTVTPPATEILPIPATDEIVKSASPARESGPNKTPEELDGEKQRMIIELLEATTPGLAMKKLFLWIKEDPSKTSLSKKEKLKFLIDQLEQQDYFGLVNLNRANALVALFLHFFLFLTGEESAEVLESIKTYKKIELKDGKWISTDEPAPVATPKQTSALPPMPAPWMVPARPLWPTTSKIPRPAWPPMPMPPPLSRGPVAPQPPDATPVQLPESKPEPENVTTKIDRLLESAYFTSDDFEFLMGHFPVILPSPGVEPGEPVPALKHLIERLDALNFFKPGGESKYHYEALIQFLTDQKRAYLQPKRDALAFWIKQLKNIELKDRQWISAEPALVAPAEPPPSAPAPEPTTELAMKEGEATAIKTRLNESLISDYLINQSTDKAIRRLLKWVKDDTDTSLVTEKAKFRFFVDELHRLGYFDRSLQPEEYTQFIKSLDTQTFNISENEANKILGWIRQLKNLELKGNEWVSIELAPTVADLPEPPPPPGRAFASTISPYDSASSDKITLVPGDPDGQRYYYQELFKDPIKLKRNLANDTWFANHLRWRADGGEREEILAVLFPPGDTTAGENIIQRLLDEAIKATKFDTAIQFAELFPDGNKLVRDANWTALAKILLKTNLSATDEEIKNSCEHISDPGARGRLNGFLIIERNRQAREASASSTNAHTDTANEQATDDLVIGKTPVKPLVLPPPIPVEISEEDTMRIAERVANGEISLEDADIPEATDEEAALAVLEEPDASPAPVSEEDARHKARAAMTLEERMKLGVLIENAEKEPDAAELQQIEELRADVEKAGNDIQFFEYLSQDARRWALLPKILFPDGIPAWHSSLKNVFHLIDIAVEKEKYPLVFNLADLYPAHDIHVRDDQWDNIIDKLVK